MNEPAIHLEQRLEAIKTNWYLWRAYRDVKLPEIGWAMQFGTVQADHQGELIAPETFEADE